MGGRRCRSEIYGMALAHSSLSYSVHCLVLLLTLPSSPLLHLAALHLTRSSCNYTSCALRLLPSIYYYVQCSTHDMMCR